MIIGGLISLVLFLIVGVTTGAGLLGSLMSNQGGQIDPAVLLSSLGGMAAVGIIALLVMVYVFSVIAIYIYKEIRKAKGDKKECSIFAKGFHLFIAYIIYAIIITILSLILIMIPVLGWILLIVLLVILSVVGLLFVPAVYERGIAGVFDAIAKTFTKRFVPGILGAVALVIVGFIIGLISALPIIGILVMIFAEPALIIFALGFGHELYK